MTAIMAQSLPSLAEPAMLRWCRTNSRLTTAQVAEKLDREEAEVQAWEDGSKSPTYAQLCRIAKLYKRPTAVFYLPEPPRDFTTLRDFRRHVGSQSNSFSPALAYQIRICRERQEWLRAQLQRDGSEPLEFVGSIEVGSDVQAAARSIRGALGVSLDEQRSFASTDVAFRNWRDKCEDLGVCVFVPAGISTEEMRGFALVDNYAPAVAVNGRERIYAAKTFTLIHELAHIFAGKEGVSDLETTSGARNDEQRVEVFCNAVAGEALVPSDDLRKTFARFGDAERAIRPLSGLYKVSEPVIARRIYDSRLATRHWFEQKLLEYARRQHEDADESRDVAIPVPVRVINSLGKRFSRTAVSAFHSGEINGPDLADLLHMRLQHLSGLEGRLVRT